VQQAVGREATVPEGGYHGDYLTELAGQVLASEGPGLADLPSAEGTIRCRELAVAAMRIEQDADLLEFGVRFDVHTCSGLGFE
jgi:arginyl-tRNA synthetase